MSENARVPLTGISPRRFDIRAVSHHPRLGRDYDPVEHKYGPAFISPKSYTVSVDVFPGKIIASVPDVLGPIAIERLLDSRITGWKFSIEGQPDRRVPSDPLSPRSQGVAAGHCLSMH